MKTLSILVIAILLTACATVPQNTEVATPQKFTLEIKGVDAVKVEQEGDGISRTMQVDNLEGELSGLSFVCKSKSRAYTKIFSGLSVSDVTRLWNDFIIIENNTDIRDFHVFINSPGGDAFSGLALADLIENAKGRGFKVTVHASGIIASAAVPVFAVGSWRIAAPGTIFMVHEASLWKWPGRETASDIRSQNELMTLLRDRYIGKLVDNSKLNKAKWEELEKKTTWFSANKALSWGLVDSIE